MTTRQKTIKALYVPLIAILLGMALGLIVSVDLQKPVALITSIADTVEDLRDAEELQPSPIEEPVVEQKQAQPETDIPPRIPAITTAVRSPRTWLPWRTR